MDKRVNVAAAAIAAIAVLVLIIFLALGQAVRQAPPFFGFCPAGMALFKGPFGEQICYSPGGSEGKPCDKSSDCGSARCILIDDKKESGKGKCSDMPVGCYRIIDENGKVLPPLCVD